MPRDTKPPDLGKAPPPMPAPVGRPGPRHSGPRHSGPRHSGWRTIREVAPYLWPKGRNGVKLRVVLALATLVIAKLVAVIVPFFLKSAVDALSEEGVPALALGAVGLTVAYGGARLLNVGLQQLRDVIFAPVGLRALRGLALRTFQHIHRLSMRYHITRKTGALSRVIERGIKGVEFLLRFLLFSIAPLVLELLLVMGILFYYFDVWYLAVVLVTVVVYVAFTFGITEWRVVLRRIMNEKDADANQKAIDSLLNFETVRYFNAEATEAARYDRAMAGYEAAALRTAWSLALLNFGQGALIALGLVAVMVMAALQVEANQLSVGDFVMVNAYMIQITLPLNFLGTLYREIRQSLVDMDEMFDLLEQPAEVIDAPGARPLVVSRGRIELRDVHFAYDSARPILRGLRLTIEPGQNVAIVGASGAGKSTLARLLFRFYDTSSGAVLIDGQDIRTITQHSLHSAIGVVPQDTVLFNDTIGYNIGYGRAGATEGDTEEATEAEIRAAARAAHIDTFIASLPKGYDTIVGERGLKLSGGEKQRVGIARTLLKNPPILLLDEATSALDSHTETAIRAALAEAGKGRTVITIAHRLSTIAEADRIVVLHAGQIAEEGTHARLLALNGRYARLWHRQMAEGEEGGEQAR